jgi:hypothetical protein
MRRPTGALRRQIGGNTIICSRASWLEGDLFARGSTVAIPQKNIEATAPDITIDAPLNPALMVTVLILFQHAEYAMRHFYLQSVSSRQAASNLPAACTNLVAQIAEGAPVTEGMIVAQRIPPTGVCSRDCADQ